MNNIDPGTFASPALFLQLALLNGVSGLIMTEWPLALEIGGTQRPTQPYTLRRKFLNFVKDYVNVKPIKMQECNKDTSSAMKTMITQINYISTKARGIMH